MKNPLKIYRVLMSHASGSPSYSALELMADSSAGLGLSSQLGGRDHTVGK